MRVVVAPIPHRSRVAKQALGRPSDDVCLSGRNVRLAVGAAVGLFGSVRGNLANKPFSTAPKLRRRTAVRQASYIAQLRGPRTAVLSGH